MYTLPSLEKVKSNKQKYLDAIGKYAAQKEIQFNEELYQENLKLLTRSHYFHQICDLDNGDKKFKGIMDAGVIFASNQISEDKSGMTMDIDRELGLDNYLFYTKGRPRLNKANEFFTFSFDNSRFSNHNYPEAFFSNDLIEIASTYKGNNKLITDNTHFSKLDLQTIWANYCDTILTIEDGMEICARLITLQFNDFEHYVKGSHVYLRIEGLFEFFQPEFKFIGEISVSEDTGIYCLVSDKKLGFYYNDKDIMDEYSDKYEVITIKELAERMIQT